MTRAGAASRSGVSAVALVAWLTATMFTTTATADVFRLLDDPHQAAQARVDLIEQARNKVDALYFLARNDRVTWMALALLRDASRRGLQVRLIVDERFNHVPGPMLAHLRDEGVQVRVYHPLSLRHPSWLFRRMHDKVIVVDSQRYIAGGRNLDDAYFNPERKRYFVDRDVYVDGPSALEAAVHFENLWASCHVADTRTDVSARSKQKAATLLDEQRTSLERAGFVQFHTGTDWSAGQWSQAETRFLHDPIDDGDGPRVADDLAAIFGTAKHSIVIESPYVIPTQMFLDVLGKRLDEGVTVQIVTNSMKSTDGLLPQVAYLGVRGFLLRMGVELHEFKGPGTLHSKSVIVDGKTAMVGSFNLDPRSQNLNTEIMVAANDDAAAEKLQAAIAADIRNAWKIASNGHTPRSYPRTSRRLRFLIWSTRLLLPFIEGQL